RRAAACSRSGCPGRSRTSRSAGRPAPACPTSRRCRRGSRGGRRRARRRGGARMPPRSARTARRASRGSQCGLPGAGVVPLPELEHAEAPEPVAVVGAPLPVLAQQPLELAAAEEPTVLPEQEVLRDRAQLLAEPAVERDAEAP